jgi:hypothetical protein
VRLTRRKKAGRVESRGRLVGLWFVYGCIAPMAGGLGLVVPLKSVVIPEMAIPEPTAGLEEVRLGLMAFKLDSLTRPGSAQV